MIAGFGPGGIGAGIGAGGKAGYPTGTGMLPSWAAPGWGTGTGMAGGPGTPVTLPVFGWGVGHCPAAGGPRVTVSLQGQAGGVHHFPKERGVDADRRGWSPGSLRDGGAEVGMVLGPQRLPMFFPRGWSTGGSSESSSEIW